MAFPSSKAVESLEQTTKEPTKASLKAEGPPPASPGPRQASADSSLYSSVGKSAMSAGASGLGAEGSEPSLIGMQGLALIQRGVQMVNLAFPENPGLVAVLGDVIGRLQMIVPQLVASSANQGMGLLTNMAQMMSPMGMGQPGMMPGMPPGGMAPGGPGGPVPPGMPPGAGPQPGMPPMGPMGPPQGGMPPRPPM